MRRRPPTQTGDPCAVFNAASPCPRATGRKNGGDRWSATAGRPVPPAAARRGHPALASVSPEARSPPAASAGGAGSRGFLRRVQGSLPRWRRFLLHAPGKKRQRCCFFAQLPRSEPRAPPFLLRATGKKRRARGSIAPAAKRFPPRAEQKASPLMLLCSTAERGALCARLFARTAGLKSPASEPKRENGGAFWLATAARWAAHDVPGAVRSPPVGKSRGPSLPTRGAGRLQAISGRAPSH